jgi:hypothetical protein
MQLSASLISAKVILNEHIHRKNEEETLQAIYYLAMLTDCKPMSTEKDLRVIQFIDEEEHHEKFESQLLPLVDGTLGLHIYGDRRFKERFNQCSTAI